MLSARIDSKITVLSSLPILELLFHSIERNPERPKNIHREYCIRFHILQILAFVLNRSNYAPDVCDDVVCDLHRTFCG